MYLIFSIWIIFTTGVVVNHATQIPTAARVEKLEEEVSDLKTRVALLETSPRQESVMPNFKKEANEP